MIFRSVGFLFSLSLLLAMILSIAHMPEGSAEFWGSLRPNWVLLVIIFWAQQLPYQRSVVLMLIFGHSVNSEDHATYRRGLVTVWIFGLALDVLLAQPLGLNGIIFASVAFFLWRNYERQALQSLIQQTAMIFVLVLVAEVVRSFVLFTTAAEPLSMRPVVCAMTSAIVWPFLFLGMLRAIGMGRF